MSGIAAKRVVRGAACGTLALLALVSCNRQKQHVASELVPLKVVAEPFLTYAPLFIAQEEGYFARQGLKVEFVKIDRTTESVAALAHGDVEVAGGLLNAGLLNAIARGARMRVVANKGYYGPSTCEYAAVVARPELVRGQQLSNAAQWRKRRVKLNRAGLSGFQAEKLFLAMGLSMDDLDIHDVSETIVPDALAHGALDAAIVGEPWVTLSTSTGAGMVWKSMQTAAAEADLGLLFFGPKLLDEHTDVGQRFMVAYLEGVRQYQQGKSPRNLEILARHTDLGRETLEKLCWVPFRDDGQPHLPSMLEFNAWAVRKGLVEARLSGPEIFDPRFLQYARRAIVTAK